MNPKQIVHSDPDMVADRRLPFQQNLHRFDIGVVVILTLSLRFRTIRTAIEPIRIRAAPAAVKTGELIEVPVVRVT